MKTGTIDGTIDDLYQVEYDSGELSTAQTSLTISNISGDVDKEYILIIRAINDNVALAYYKVRFNNDTGSNYGTQQILGENSAISAARWTADGAPFGSAGGSGGAAMAIATVHAKSGYVRTLHNCVAYQISGTTVSDLGLRGQSWNNDSDNITSLVVVSSVSDGLGVGSRIILLKKVVSTDGIKAGNLEVQGDIENAWQKIYGANISGSSQTTVTISNLDGDNDILYKLIVRTVNDYNGAVDTIYLKPNNDTGSNYGYQFIRAYGSTADASRSAGHSNGIMRLGRANNLNELSISETLMYAKSGYVRIAIVSASAEAVSGTTVGYLDYYANCWNNTANNITSLVVGAIQTNGLGVGTQIELYRLNL